MTFVLQDGCSPLIAASWKGHLGVVKTLLEAGANINQANKVQLVDMYPVVTGCHTCPYIVSPLHWLHVAPCYTCTCSTSYSTYTVAVSYQCRSLLMVQAHDNHDV